MAIKFTAASSQYITNTSPAIVNYPWSAGFWLNPQEVASTVYYFFLGEAATNQGFYLNATSSDLKFFCYDFVDFPDATISGALTANAWHYVLMRAINATNRRLSIIKPTGALDHAQSTVDATLLATATRMSLGAEDDNAAGAFSNSMIGEFFYTGTDIQGDGAETDPLLLRQLAYRGPGSIQRIKKDIIEYRSIRTHPTAGHRPDIYFGPRGPQAWANVGGATIGPHPPHAQPWNRSYIRPGQSVGNRVAYVPDEPVAPSASARAQRGGFIANVGGLMGRF